jgi:hypothetical protein
MRVRLGPSKSPMYWGDLEVTVLVSRTIVLVPIKPRVLMACHPESRRR